MWFEWKKTWECMKESETNPDTSLRVFFFSLKCATDNWVNSILFEWTRFIVLISSVLLSLVLSAEQIASGDQPWLTLRIHVKFCESWIHSCKRSLNLSRKCCLGKLYSYTQVTCLIVYYFIRFRYSFIDVCWLDVRIDWEAIVDKISRMREENSFAEQVEAMNYHWERKKRYERMSCCVKE